MILYLLLFLSVNSTKVIELNNNNLVNIYGPINSESAKKFNNDIMNKTKYSKTINVYIKSPGGSVMSGNNIVTTINMLKEKGYTINCITDFSASMAFIIMQSCSNRYGLPHVTMMQHQMSLGIKGDINRINSYLSYISYVKYSLNKMQSDRIGMKYDVFNDIIKDEWWIYGNRNVELNILDDIVYINCNGDFEDYFLETFFYDIDNKGCPLLN
jgi:ATP-dependent protease ClpP protease subunit